MKKLRKFIIILFISLFLFNGCGTFSSKLPEIPPQGQTSVERTRMDSEVNAIEANSKDIGALTSTISSTSETIHKKNPSLVEMYVIREGASKIKLLNDQNINSVAKLAVISKEISQVDKVVTELKKQIVKYEDESYRKQKSMWIIVSSCAALGLIASIFLTLTYSPKIGVPLMIGCVATIAIATFMAAYIQLVAIAGGFIVFSVLIYFIYRAWIERKALDESIVTMEVTKNAVWNDKVSKKVDALQSPTTKAIVKEKKDELKKKGYYNLPTPEDEENSEGT